MKYKQLKSLHKYAAAQMYTHMYICINICEQEKKSSFTNAMIYESLKVLKEKYESKKMVEYKINF